MVTRHQVPTLLNFGDQMTTGVIVMMVYMANIKLNLYLFILIKSAVIQALWTNVAYSTEYSPYIAWTWAVQLNDYLSHDFLVNIVIKTVLWIVLE